MTVHPRSLLLHHAKCSLGNPVGRYHRTYGHLESIVTRSGDRGLEVTHARQKLSWLLDYRKPLPVPISILAWVMALYATNNSPFHVRMGHLEAI